MTALRGIASGRRRYGATSSMNSIGLLTIAWSQAEERIQAGLVRCIEFGSHIGQEENGARTCSQAIGYSPVAFRILLSTCIGVKIGFDKPSQVTRVSAGEQQFLSQH